MLTVEQKTFPVSWDQLHRDSRALAWRLVQMGPFKGIAAITRGGLVPAAVIARELDVRLIDTICIVSYRDDHSQGELEVLKPVEHYSEGWLLIDDLVDTGKTARKVRELMPKAHFATVYAKPAGRPLAMPGRGPVVWSRLGGRVVIGSLGACHGLGGDDVRVDGAWLPAFPRARLEPDAAIGGNVDAVEEATAAEFRGRSGGVVGPGVGFRVVTVEAGVGRRGTRDPQPTFILDHDLRARTTHRCTQ